MWDWVKWRFYKIGSTVAIFLMWRRIKREPFEPSFWELQTELYLIKGNIAKARYTINKAIQLFPENERILAKEKRVQEYESNLGA